jgi:hypothetical protein
MEACRGICVGNVRDAGWLAKGDACELGVGLGDKRTAAANKPVNRSGGRHFLGV